MGYFKSIAGRWNLYRRLASLGLLALALTAAFVFGCAHGWFPELPRDRWDEAVRWPLAPNEPRIVHVGEIRSGEDIVKARGFWGAIANTLLGAKTETFLDRPLDIAMDSSGRLLVADPGLRAVVVFDTSSGKTFNIREIPKGRLLSPVGVSVDADDNIYVTDSVLGYIVTFFPDGKHRLDIGAGKLRRPTGVVVDKKRKRIFVVDTLAHQIKIFDLSGRELAAFGDHGSGVGELNFPIFIALDGMGNIWVVDSMNARVQCFDGDGRYVRSFGQRGDSAGSFARPKGIAVDSEQHVYVVDALFDNVQIFSQEGQLLLYFGRQGVGNGEFWLPAGIVIDKEDRIFVADSFNHRIQLFRYLKLGTFE